MRNRIGGGEASGYPSTHIDKQGIEAKIGIYCIQYIQYSSTEEQKKQEYRQNKVQTGY